MSDRDEIWLPLVDEPIGSIVQQLQADDPEIDRLVGSPRRILAFRTFAYIRVGVKLGELLVENDVPPYDGTDTWIDLLLRDPANRDAIAREVRAVAEEIGADPSYGEDDPLGPDEEARARFREFARRLDAILEAAITGSTIRAAMSSTPTICIETATVVAASTASTTLSAATGTPATCAPSSSR